MKNFILKKSARFLSHFLLIFSLSFTFVQIKHHPFVQKLMIQLADHSEHVSTEKIYVHLDRKFYQPGEAIWFKAYVKNANDLSNANISSAVYVELLDPKGTSVSKKKVLTSKGAGSGVFDLNNVIGGLYKIRAYTNWSLNQDIIFERDVQVQKVILPKLKMTLDFKRKAYGAGDKVQADLKLEGLDNEVLRYAPYEMIVQVQGKELMRLSEQTDFDGKALLDFQLPNELTSNDALLQVLIPHKGMNESISKSIPIVLNDIDLQFFPEGGELVNGLKTKLAFKALNEFGKAADIEGAIYNADDEILYEFKSFHQGMGVINFWPDDNVTYYAKITKPPGIEKEYAIPHVNRKGLGITVHSNDKNKLELFIQSKRYEEVHLVAHANDKILYSKTLKLKGKEIIKIPTDDFPMGISKLTLFDKNGNPHSERLVFVNPHKKLDISIKTDKQKYLPREKVKMVIQITDEDGHPVKGDFSVSVADGKLLSFADDKQGDIFAKIFLESELKGKIDEPNFYFDKDEPKAIAALDLLMMTHGWRKFEWKSIQTETPIAFKKKKDRAVIAGKVVDECGDPVANADVTFNDIRVVTTNETGDFELNRIHLKEKGNLLKISKEALPTIYKSIVDYKDDFFIIQAEGYASLSGKIMTPTGHQASRFVTTLYNDEGIKWTNNNYRSGEYAFQNIPTGEYTLRISSKRYRSHQVERIRIWPGQNIQVSRKLKAPSEANELFVSKYDLEMETLNDEWLTITKDKQPANQPSTSIQKTVTFGSIERSGGGGVELDEIIVTEYKVPLIRQDETTQGGVVSSEQISVLPTKNIGALAAMTAGLSQVDEGDAISVRGSRPNGTDVYVDGIRVNSSAVQSSDIEQLAVISGGLPAVYSGGSTVGVKPTYRIHPKFGNSNEPEMHRYMIEDGNPLDYEGASGFGSAINIYSGGGGGGSGYSRPSRKYHRYPTKIYTLVDEIPRLKYKLCERLKDISECRTCASSKLMEKIQKAIDQAYVTVSNNSGNALINFYVNEKGNIGDVHVLFENNKYNYYVQQKIRSALYKLNKAEWIPAKKEDKRVTARYSIPIVFGDVNSHHYTEYGVSRKFYAPKYKKKQAVEKRTDFRSTIYWHPNIQTGNDGKAKLEFWNSDDLTSFVCTVEGFSNNGLVGRQTHQYYTQMPFSLDTKVPVSFLSGDEVKIPITLTNNMDQTIEGELEVDVPECFDLIQAVDKKYTLEPGKSISVYPTYGVSFDCPRGVTSQKIEVRFTSSNISDAFTQKITVNSSSYPIHKLFTGSGQNNVFDINIEKHQKGSMELKFKAHPNICSEVMASLDRLIRQPHGCFEQTSSCNYPNLLVMQYMKENPKAFKKETYAKAEGVLKAGYKRLMGFEVIGGGFDWYGKIPAHESLTAYGLMQFTDMKSVYPVKEAMIKRTANWLLRRRDGKGSWKYSMKRKFSWKGSNEIRDAYIVWAMCEAGYGDKIHKEIEKSYKDAIQSQDPYIMACIANALFQIKDHRATTLLNSIMLLQDDSTGRFIGKSTSITNSRGKNLDLETTALCILAMLESTQAEEGKTWKAIEYLIKSKSKYGFGSTQSTVLSLKALIEYSQFKNTENNQRKGNIELLVNGERIQDPIPFNTANSKTIVINDLANKVMEGNQKIEVHFIDTNMGLPFELELSYNTKLPPNQEGDCKIAISTQLGSSKIGQGEAVRLTTKLSNLTTEDQASPLVIIGIPVGLSPQLWQLKEIQEKKLIDYYEVIEDKVVFYFEAITANETKIINLDLKADIPGSFEAAPSCAYLYYENDVVAWQEPGKIEINPVVSVD